MSEIKNGNWSQEKIRDKLKQLHEQENNWNRELNRLQFQKWEIEKKMNKIRKCISSNHKYRTILTTYLLPPEPTKKIVSK